MSRPIEGRGAWALVTGAASGIGLEIARQFLAQGWQVLLVDRDPSVHDIAHALDTSGARTASCVADLSDESQLRLVVGRALALEGGCGVVVNCAAVHPKRNGRYAATAEIGLQEFEQVMRVNVSAPFLLCQGLMPAMQQRGWGRVVNIASRTGRTFTGSAGLHYTASKAALIGMTRQLAGESAPNGVTVNCVAPGRIETPLLRQVHPDIIEAAVRQMPARRLGTPAEVAAVVVFLASDGAAFITGACIDANGGDFMG